MQSQILSAAIYGVDVKTVEIEVNATECGNEDRTIIVGLPDAAIRESKERVISSIFASGLYVPHGKTTINLAPADLKKSGTAYDLPMALGIIATQGKIESRSLEGTLIIGELALNGKVRPIKGALPIASYAKALGLNRIILPAENAQEAAAAQEITVIGVNSLREAVRYLLGLQNIQATTLELSALYANVYQGIPDFEDVKGQEGAKRALTVAVAGNHNVLLVGPPGCGKTLLSKRIPGIMPPLSLEESLEVTKIHSIAGVLDPRQGLITQRPFRNPHHTVSDAGLVGGQMIPRPGELSLAHCGVLFLDELPEFRRNVLEVLRQPLESGEVTLSRASGTFVFPAKIMLVAAMNPCPCGYFGSSTHRCRCSPMQVQAYRGRLSGPLLDRIDIQVELMPLSNEVLTSKRNGENSATIRQRVLMAREIQRKRYANTPIRDNSMLSGKIMDAVCPLTTECTNLLTQIISELRLSARAYDRILRIARTIADLEGVDRISPMHIMEAANYRIFDRQKW